MKKPKKRWGKNKKYKRNWKIYNAELIKRGNFYLDFDWVKNWHKELAEMNYKKVGRPFEFPESLIKLQSIWAHFLDYRGVQGITEMICDIGKIPQFNHYSTINRRINKMKVHFQLPRNKEINVACDGSGMKMNMSGEYFYEKYGDGKKKFIKVTISADPFEKDIFLVDVSLEGEELSEPEVAMTHIEELNALGYTIKTFWGDGAFDVHDLFDILDLYSIESAIKIRENAVVDPGGGSVRRGIEVTKYQEEGYEKWAKKRKYGMRWPGTEGIFSSVKGKFGERVRSKNEKNMLKEVKRKFWAYQIIKNYARA